jgi:gas vesicle protein
MDARKGKKPTKPGEEDNMRGVLSFLSGVASGLVVGASLAILLAPTSGEDLRKQMQDRAERIQLEVKQAADTRRQELEQQLETLRAPRKA